jgi:hypothetical protein
MNKIGLNKLEFSIQLLVAHKFARVVAHTEEDNSLQAHLIAIIGSAMGETLDYIKFPTNWERLLKRKDCPNYMKNITEINVNVYYPRISLPNEKNCIEFDKIR